MSYVKVVCGHLNLDAKRLIRFFNKSSEKMNLNVREFCPELCVWEKFSIAVMGDLLGYQNLNFLSGRTSVSGTYCISVHSWGLYCWKLCTDIDH